MEDNNGSNGVVNHNDDDKIQRLWSRAYPSIIQMETSDFKTAKIHEKREQCPKCGSVLSYNKSNYFFL